MGITLVEPKRSLGENVTILVAYWAALFLTAWVVMVVLPLADHTWTPGYWKVFWSLFVASQVVSFVLWSPINRLVKREQ